MGAGGKMKGRFFWKNPWAVLCSVLVSRLDSRDTKPFKDLKALMHLRARESVSPLAYTVIHMQMRAHTHTHTHTHTHIYIYIYIYTHTVKIITSLDNVLLHFWFHVHSYPSCIFLSLSSA